jgi:hypothetical protein
MANGGRLRAYAWATQTHFGARDRLTSPSGSSWLDTVCVACGIELRPLLCRDSAATSAHNLESVPRMVATLGVAEAFEMVREAAAVATTVIGATHGSTQYAARNLTRREGNS